MCICTLLICLTIIFQDKLKDKLKPYKYNQNKIEKVLKYIMSNEVPVFTNRITKKKHLYKDTIIKEVRYSSDRNLIHVTATNLFNPNYDFPFGVFFQKDKYGDFFYKKPGDGKIYLKDILNKKTEI